MKKVLFAIGLLISLFAKGQIYQQHTLFGEEFNRSYFKYPIGIIGDTIPPPIAYQNKPHIAAKGDSIYLWSTSQSKWILSGGISSELDPTVNTIIKNIPVSADASTNKYLNWNGSAYVRKQIDYSEISGTPVESDPLSWHLTGESILTGNTTINGQNTRTLLFDSLSSFTVKAKSGLSGAINMYQGGNARLSITNTLSQLKSSDLGSYFQTQNGQAYISSTGQILMASLSADQYATDSLVWRIIDRSAHFSLYPGIAKIYGGVSEIELSTADGIEINGTSLKILNLSTDNTATQVLGKDGSGNSVWRDVSSIYTDEQAQDAVGAMVANSSKVSLTYTDATPELKADIVAGSLVNADINASAAIDATKIADGSVTSTEFQYINTLSSNAQTQIDGKQAQLNGTGFVKVSGTTVSYDNSTYLTTETDPNAVLLTGNQTAAGNKTFSGITTLDRQVLNLQSIATAAGTTTFTTSTVYHTIFTGTTTQTVSLPDATTLANGHRYRVTNNSTGDVTIRDNGSNVVLGIAGSTSIDLYLKDNSTANGLWGYDYDFVTAGSSGVRAEFQSSMSFAGGGTPTTVMTMPASNANIAAYNLSNAWSDGVKQTFNPDATNAGINVGAHTADPSSLNNGDIWYNSTSNELKARINGASVALGAGGSGNVTKVGTPANNQIGVWTGDGTIEGDGNLTWDGSQMVIAGSGRALKIDNASGDSYMQFNTTGNTTTIGTEASGSDRFFVYDDDVGVFRLKIQSDGINIFENTAQASIVKFKGSAREVGFGLDGNSLFFIYDYTNTLYQTAYTSDGKALFGNITSSVSDAKVQVNGSVSVAEVTAPSTPSTGNVIIYAKSDGKLYSKDDAGTEYDLTTGGSSGITVGTTTISSGTNGSVLYDNSGVVGEIAKATAATASTLVQRDADANITANNWLGGYTTTATAAGTTTLTVASSYLQYFTGTTTQTVTLPVVSTLALGTQYVIVNNSTGNVTVNSSGGNAVVVLAGGTSTVVTSIATTGTGAAVWSNAYSGVSVASGKKVTQNNSITYAGTDATTMTFPSTSANVVGETQTQTLTNKRITKRTGTVANSSSLTIDSDAIDEYTVTALTGAITINNPTGTPTEGQTLLIRLKDNGTARAITWGTNFRAGSDISLPTTTTISKHLYVGFVWNATDSKWDLVTSLNGY